MFSDAIVVPCVMYPNQCFESYSTVSENKSSVGKPCAFAASVFPFLPILLLNGNSVLKKSEISEVRLRSD